jgi:transglutaminase-like putative cysteine protease
MHRITALLFALLLTLAATAWGAERSGVVTVSVDLSAKKAGEPARLWLPYPVSDRQQSIGNIRLAGDFADSGVYTDPVHGTPILYAAWPADATSRKLTLAFSVDRKEQRVVLTEGKEPQWNPADYAAYLGATTLGPTDGEVKKLADKITKGKKTVLAKAKAIYDWTVENMYRDPETRGCGLGDVCLLLTRPGGKCTDISSVYVALCRAAGIPAREVFGLRLGKKAEEEITTWQHCWVEFFLPGSGWVPVDPADVRKAMLVEKLELKDARVQELRAYFWGGVDAYRFKLATGRDLVLNPPQAGAPLNTFGYPYAEVGGVPLDFYDAKAFTYRIDYREK